MRKSEFTGNSAAFGGGLYWYGGGADVIVDDCIIRGNTAEHGGGLYWSGGAPTINNCIIRGNAALGEPATIYVTAPTPDPNDPNTWPAPSTWPDPNDPNSMFDPNNPFTPPPLPMPGDPNCGTGGGLYCLSSEALIENSLHQREQGQRRRRRRLLRRRHAQAQELPDQGQHRAGRRRRHQRRTGRPRRRSRNCTIVGNEASDPNNSNHGYGGGLFCTHESQTILLDSILWDNNGQFGDQIAIGSQDDPRSTCSGRRA